MAATQDDVKNLIPLLKDCKDFQVLADQSVDEKAWLQARKSLITASSVPAILGIVPGKVRLWYELRGEVAPENLDHLEYVSLGSHLEPFVASAFSKKTGRKLVPCHLLLQSKRFPWLGCTLDYLQDVPDQTHAELKATAKDENWRTEPHLRYQTQLQSQLAVTGKPWGSIAAFVSAPTMRVPWCDRARHEAFINYIAEETYRFWESLRTGPPPVDDSKDTTTLLRSFAFALGERRRLPLEAIGWARDLEEARARKIRAEADARIAENHLLTALRGAKVGELMDGTFVVQESASVKTHTVPEHERRTLRRKDAA